VRNHTLTIKALGESVVSYATRDSAGVFHARSGAATQMGNATAEMTGWGDDLLLKLEEIGATEGEIPASKGTLTYDGVVANAGGAVHSISFVPAADAPRDEDGMRLSRLVVQFDTATLLASRIDAVLAQANGADAELVVDYGDWRAVS
jgi:hypothetical protein